MVVGFPHLNLHDTESRAGVRVHQILESLMLELEELNGELEAQRGKVFISMYTTYEWHI